jgi:esterase/lipase superfamily enzyme
MSDYRWQPIQLRVTLQTDHPGLIDIFLERVADQSLSHVATSRFDQSAVFNYSIGPNNLGSAILAKIRVAGALAITITVFQGSELLAQRDLNQETPEATVAIRFEGPVPAEIGWLSHSIEPRFLAGNDRGRPKRDDVEYRVWFATTRKAVNSPGSVARYSTERDDHLRYGYCDVFVPRSHKIGSTGSPWWRRLLTRTDDRLGILGIEETTASTQWEQIVTRLSALSPAERNAVLFVHGYNVSFESAALRAAQIGTDLGIAALAFFSWPSQGTVDGYVADSAAIEANELAIASYMAEFVANCGATTVHVIAHSMGNRGVLRAVNLLANAGAATGIRQFGQFILAAPDVDIDTFSQLSAAYGRLGSRTTLYVCSQDRAVEASRWLHRYPRVGLVPPVIVFGGIDTVNVTNADLTFLGHGYVAEARDVLMDMHSVVTRNVPPEARFGLIRQTTGAGQVYWAIGA